jgi:DNA mismatch endonuclease (patch repair protein)
MSRIRGADTKPELVVRRLIHALGLRFRLHRRDLPGSPDLVLPRHRTAVFVHGCFWHRHAGCRNCTTPTRNQDFWLDKFRRNVERDSRKSRELRRLGWRVLTVWECETQNAPRLVRRLQRLLLAPRGLASD